MYREISQTEFLRERAMRFTPDSPEVTGIRFGTPVPRSEASEAAFRGYLSRRLPDPDWQSKLGPISQVMPLDFEAYAAIILPWTAFRGDRGYKAEGVVDAYRFFDLPVPERLSLDRLFSDFQVIEGASDIPLAARHPLDRFAGDADAIFVKAQEWGSNEARYWSVSRELFFAADNPFAALEPELGLFAIFPRGGAWYIHHSNDRPILYLAAGRVLLDALAVVLADRLLPLSLTDRYYA